MSVIVRFAARAFAPIALAGACALATDASHPAERYPARNIRLVVPFAPGGNVDVTTLDARAPGLPDVPTVKEVGLPNVEVVNFSAILAPAGTPRAIIQRLNEVTVSVLRMPATRKSFARFGATTNETSPEDAIRFIRAGIEKWRKLIRAAGISTKF